MKRLPLRLVLIIDFAWLVLRIAALPVTDELAHAWRYTQQTWPLIWQSIQAIPARLKPLPLWLVSLIALTVPYQAAWQAVQFVAWAAGAVRYVDAVAGTCTGNYSIVNRDCTGSDGNSYATAALGIAATASGDTLYIREGTYSATIGTSIVGGVSDSVRTVISAYNDEAVTVTLEGSSHGIYITNKDNITLHGIDWDASAMVAANGIKLESNVDNVTLSGPPWQTRCKLHGAGNDGFNVQGVNSNIKLIGCEIYGNGYAVLTAPYAHGAYFQRVTGLTVERNYFHTNGCYQMQIYPYTQNAVVTRNRFSGDNTTSACSSTVVLSNSGHLFERNIIQRDSGSGGFALRLQYGTGGTPSNDIIRHNTIIGPWDACIYVASNGDSNALQNNILNGCTTKVDDLGTNTVEAGNLETGTPVDMFTSVVLGAYDLTLKAGSVAIDGGVDIGLSKCGSAPDQGAHEVCGFSSASITGHIVDVTIENLYPPVQLFGSAGWSISCTPNPDACGSPTVLSVSLVGSSVARLTLAGLSNTDCTTDQIFTVSYDASALTVADYILMGIGRNQAAHSFTGRAVTNNCTGSGGPEPPTGAYIYYPMDSNANDSSGGNRHATTSGVTFAAAKYSDGMQTDAAQNDYAELPYLNGVNPSTQSLTIAFGVYVAATDLGNTRDVFGVPIGTNQRLYIFRHSSNNWRMGIQANAGAATEFTASSGWNYVCLTFNAGTDTATLSINGVAGAAAGASVQTYTSYTFPGNGRIGLPSGFASSLGGNHLYDEFRLYQSVESCADLYAAWEPPTSGWTGTLSVASARIYSAKTNWLGSTMPLAAVDANAFASPGGAFTYAGQIDCTAADCTAVSYKLYYSCASCPSAGAELPVPDTATSDEIEMFGTLVESGLLTGAHGANLSGALSHVNGTTLITASTTSGPDLAQNNSTVHRATMRFTTSATVGRQYCFKWREQSGLELDSYTPSGGVCVTVGAPGAAAGF